MTTLILGPVLALTLVSVTTAGPSPVATRASTVRVTAFTIAKPDLVDAVTAATPPAAPPAAAPATSAPAARPRPAAKPVVKTPRPAPPPSVGPPASPGSVVAIIEAAAARWGVSGSWMVSIARCESGLRTTAYNPNGPYIGLFQFLQSTFRANGGTNIYDAADQSNIAAKMLAHGQAHQWSCA